MQTLERVAAAAQAASLGLALLAACLCAAARALTPAAGAAAAGALLAWWLAKRVLRARYEKFINSLGAWRRDGGLSLVPGQVAPIRL